MMPVFKVGEVAIGCNMVNEVAYNGMECEIIEDLVVGVDVLFVHGWKRVTAYYVRWQDGVESYVEPTHLRKKRPPEADDAAARQAMLDCIERAKLPVEVAHADQA